MRKIITLLLASIFLLSGIAQAKPLDGEWKPYLDLLLWVSPSDLGVKVQPWLERHFVNIASYDSVITFGALREKLNYGGYHVICLLGCSKSGVSLDIPADVETLIEERCTSGISGLIVSGDVIHPDSNNFIIQKLVGAQLSDSVRVSRTTVRVIDITDPVVADVAQSYDCVFGDLRKAILYPGTKKIAVTNENIDILFKRTISSSKAYYIALGTNGQAIDNIEVSRVLSNALYDSMGSGWLQPCEAPKNIKAIAGDGKVRLTWEMPDKQCSKGVTGFRIYRESEGEKPRTIHDFPIGIDSDLAYPDYYLDNGKEYIYKICSVGDKDRKEITIGCSNIVRARPDKIKIELPPRWPQPGGIIEAIGEKYIVKGTAKPGSKVIIEWKLIPSGRSGKVEGIADQNGEFTIPIPLDPGQKTEYSIIVENELGDQEKIGPFTVDCKDSKIIISVTIGSKKAYVNNLEWPEDITPPFISSGRTLVPFRFIGERLFAKVGWVAEEKKVTYELGPEYIELWIGKKDARHNGILYKLDQEPVIKSNHTMVPVRFVTEHLGAKVDWIEKARMVFITYPDPSKQP